MFPETHIFSLCLCSTVGPSEVNCAEFSSVPVPVPKLFFLVWWANSHHRFFHSSTYFSDDLYRSSSRESIHVFRDEKLQRGEVIALELMKAIEESEYAIIVLSEKYADSKWCLDELAKIVECRKKTGLTVLPVFFHVDPSHVRNQTEESAMAFAKNENDERFNVEKMQKWKEALREVANIYGWHLNDR